MEELEHFLGTLRWHHSCIPFYAQRAAPLQQLKTKLLHPGPSKGQARKKGLTSMSTKNNMERPSKCTATLAHYQNGKPLYVYVDSSGTG
ncbi:hypothetical protein TWF481_002824 [Arthrobotrys musiformis]|uniref:Uncharacterized protein n=1 Tax=Arthrobotrys musiformis TaxID=47236 RepID=A0AAV9VSF7_9PEZI